MTLIIKLLFNQSCQMSKVFKLPVDNSHKDNNIMYITLAAVFFSNTLLDLTPVEQELLTLLEHLSSPPDFQWGSCYSIFSFICMFCRSLFIFFWPLCCLFFFDIQILINPLVSSNSSINMFSSSLYHVVILTFFVYMSELSMDYQLYMIISVDDFTMLM